MNRTITFEHSAVDLPVTSGRRVGIITPTDRVECPAPVRVNNGLMRAVSATHDDLAQSQGYRRRGGTHTKLLGGNPPSTNRCWLITFPKEGNCYIEQPYICLDGYKGVTQQTPV